MQKLRVWWVSQVGVKPFYVPVKSVEDAKKVMEILAAHDAYEYQNNIKPDYANCGGLEMWNAEEQSWESWECETAEGDYFDDVDDYCNEVFNHRKSEFDAFHKELFSQIEFD